MTDKEKLISLISYMDLQFFTIDDRHALIFGDRVFEFNIQGEIKRIIDYKNENDIQISKAKDK